MSTATNNAKRIFQFYFLFMLSNVNWFAAYFQVDFYKNNIQLPSVSDSYATSISYLKNSIVLSFQVNLLRDVINTLVWLIADEDIMILNAHWKEMNGKAIT